MSDRRGIGRRLLLAGLLAAAQQPAAAQGQADSQARRGPASVPTLLRGRGQQVLRAGISLDGSATAQRDPFGIPDGLAAQIGQILAAGLDVRLELVETDPRQDVDELRAGRFDLLLNAPPLMIQVAREILHADAYAHLDFTILAGTTTELRSVVGLAGKRIGIQAGRTEQLLASRLPPGIAVTVHPLKDLDAMQAAFRAGTVDALAASSAAADRLVRHHRDIEVKLTLGELWIGPACRFGDHDLLRAVNTVLYVARQEGLLAVLHQEFYDRPLPRPPFF